jgi:hypothetical protein
MTLSADYGQSIMVIANFALQPFRGACPAAPPPEP